VILPQGKDYAFAPVSSSAVDTRRELSRVVRDRPKFFCLNNHLSRDADSFESIFNEVQEFLVGQYPSPSPFERQQPWVA